MSLTNCSPLENDVEEPIKDNFMKEDYSKVKHFINELENIVAENDRVFESNFEKYQFILDGYQEQPHLLDTHLDELVAMLTSRIRMSKDNDVLQHALFKYLAHLTKVRGYKCLVRRLPHAASDFDEILSLLESKSTNYESQYMLLIWMSTLCKIPIELRKLQCNSGTIPLAERVIICARCCISSADRRRDAAAHLFGCILTRPDTSLFLFKEVNLFCNWLLSCCDLSHLDNVVRACGTVLALIKIFDFGKRDDLLQFASQVMTVVKECKLLMSSNALLRRLSAKLIQRLGLTFLKPSLRLLKNKYAYSAKQLTDSFVDGSNKSNTAVHLREQNHFDNIDEDTSNVSEEVEEILQILLQMLADVDTSVRWTIAKGLGYIGGRLPTTLAYQLIQWILESLSKLQTSEMRHGGLMAIAELSRRHLLRFDIMQPLLDLLESALFYDQQRAKMAVGSSVRDAACFLSWSICRSTERHTMKPFIVRLTSLLLSACIFDKEVQCRRAASAALQEAIGRQGAENIPHGLQLISICDYYAVGNLRHCYLQIAPDIAEFNEYRLHFIDYLAKVKLSHWDVELRNLAAESLGLLIAKEINLVSHYLSDLINTSLHGNDLFYRHGCLLAVGFMVAAAFKLNFAIGSEELEGIYSMVETVRKSQHYCGLNGEMMRIAINKLIYNLSLTEIIDSTNASTFLNIWFDALNDNIMHTNDDVRNSACESLKILYMNLSNKEVIIQKAVSYLHLLSSTNNETQRRGAANALATFPTCILNEAQILHSVLNELSVCAVDYSDVHITWFDARCACIVAISAHLQSNNIEHFVNESLILKLVDVTLKALDDYTTDSHGDVGSFVRESAMEMLSNLMIHDTSHRLLWPVSHCFGKIIQQSCEKIDRTRICAATVLFRLLNNYEDERIPSADITILKKVYCWPDSQWNLSRVAFSRLSLLLSSECFFSFALFGFIISAGSQIESTSQAAMEALLEALSEIETQILSARFLPTICEIFRSHSKQDRVTLPLMRVLYQLLNSSCEQLWADTAAVNVWFDIFELSITEAARSKSILKLLTAIPLWCAMIQIGDPVCQKAVKQMIKCLSHAYPRIRRAASQELYNALLAYGALDNHSEQALGILDQNDWSQDVAMLKDARDLLIQLLKVD